MHRPPRIVDLDAGLGVALTEDAHVGADALVELVASDALLLGELDEVRLADQVREGRDVLERDDEDLAQLLFGRMREDEKLRASGRGVSAETRKTARRGGRDAH